MNLTEHGQELLDLVARFGTANANGTSPKIDAIKHVRAVCGLGLKESKEFVESLERVEPEKRADFLGQFPCFTVEGEREIAAQRARAAIEEADARLRETTESLGREQAFSESLRADLRERDSLIANLRNAYAEANRRADDIAEMLDVERASFSRAMRENKSLRAALAELASLLVILGETE